MSDSMRASAAIRERTFVQQVYGWMAAALAVTGFVALAVSRSVTIQQIIFGNRVIFFGLIIGELVLVIALARRIMAMSAATATTVFIIYSILNGLTLSSVFLVYTGTTITQAFLVTAGVFGVMTVYGFVTRTDLTRLGNLLLMALLGFIIATVVNLFVASETLYWIITYAGVVLFVGLTAYHTQNIKRMAQAGFDDSETEQKAAVLGALRLYLDFINLFLLFLRILGRRR